MGTFLIGTGIGFRSLNIKTTWEETEKIKAVPGKSAEPEFDTIGRVLEERFTIVTFPIFVSYKMNWKKWYGTAGTGIAFDVFSGKQTNPNRHKKYVTEAIKKGEKYSEKYHISTTNLLLEIRAGYSISDHLLISGGIEHHLALSPFYQNTLYQLKSNALVFDMGLMWLLDRNSSK